METITRKVRSDDRLSQLPDEKQRFIIRLLSRMSYRDVITQLAKPEPEGLGIEVSYASIQRFYSRNVPEQILQQRRCLFENFEQAAALMDAAPNPYSRVARELVEKHIMDLSMDPRGREEKLVKLGDFLLRTRALELQERRVALEEAKQARPPADSPVNVNIFAAIEARIEKSLHAALSKATPILSQHIPLPTPQSPLPAQIPVAHPLDHAKSR